MNDKQLYSAQADVLGTGAAANINKVLKNTYMLLGAGPPSGALDFDDVDKA